MFVQLQKGVAKIMLTKLARAAVSATTKKNYKSLSAFYDRIIAIANFGRRSRWMEELISQLPIKRSTRILDMAGGQGPVTFAFLERAQLLSAEGCVSYVCDISEEMQACGKNKARRLNHGADAVKWVHGDLHQMPFDDAFFDACILFFGIRKLDLTRVFGEAHRVLKPGGHFFVFDLARPKNPIVDWLFWQFHVRQMVPRLLGLSRDERASYKSAVDDMNIPHEEEMIRLLKTASFGEIKCTARNLGIAKYYTCLKV